MPMISVALCTFNGARFVERQLRSILDQTLLPGEIVIADDGSSDETLDVVSATIDAYRNSAIEIRVLESASNLGVTANFERAVTACRGGIIALSDQDDFWHPDRLASAVGGFDNPALLLQHGDARLVDAEGHPIGISLFEALRISSREREAISSGNVFGAYLRRNLATGATMLFRKDLLNYALPFPREWVHDEWLAIIAAALGEVHMLNEPLIDYRQHGGNQIGVKKPTLRYRVGRMLQPRGDRYQILAARAQILSDRLAALPTPSAVRELARDRARFDVVRSNLPEARIARLGSILREWRAGSYTRLSSQGGLDVIRDLLQPA